MRQIGFSFNGQLMGWGRGGEGGIFKQKRRKSITLNLFTHWLVSEDTKRTKICSSYRHKSLGSRTRCITVEPGGVGSFKENLVVNSRPGPHRKKKTTTNLVN